jgi:hypothetical protein
VTWRRASACDAFIHLADDRSVLSLRKRLQGKLLELQQHRQAVVHGQQQAAASVAAAAQLIESRIPLVRQALDAQKQALYSSYSSDEAMALQQLQQVASLSFVCLARAHPHPTALQIKALTYRLKQQAFVAIGSIKHCRTCASDDALLAAFFAPPSYGVFDVQPPPATALHALRDE